MSTSIFLISSWVCLGWHLLYSSSCYCSVSCEKLTLMLSASTLAPASSRMWTASTFPASTAQCSGVFLFTLSTALTEALFLIKKLVGSGLGQNNNNSCEIAHTSVEAVVCYQHCNLTNPNFCDDNIMVGSTLKFWKKYSPDQEYFSSKLQNVEF